MTAPASDHVLEVIGLKKAFGGLTVTQDVSLAIRPGERRLIIGPNGAGKTTLFNQISGDMRPNSGQIKLFGTDVTQLPPYQRAHLGLSRTYQIITLFSGDTLEHNITLGLLGFTLRERNMGARQQCDHLAPARHHADGVVGPPPRSDDFTAGQ